MKTIIADSKSTVLIFRTFKQIFMSRHYPFQATCPWNGGRALPALLPVFLYSKVSSLKSPWQFSSCFLFLFKMFDQLDEGLYFGFLSSGPICKISHWDQCEDHENIKNFKKLKFTPAAANWPIQSFKTKTIYSLVALISNLCLQSPAACWIKKPVLVLFITVVVIDRQSLALKSRFFWNA